MEQVGLAATNEVTLWALFIQAGFVVKLVMVGLVGASIWTWAIILDKSFNYVRARRQFDRFEQVFWSGQSLEELYQMLTGRKTGDCRGVACHCHWLAGRDSGGDCL